MVSGRIAIFSFVFVLMIAAVNAEINNVEYQFVIEENGNTIVGITITGSGTLDIPIQRDVDDVRVEGGLYVIEDDILGVAIGPDEKAVVLYKTSQLTEKFGEEWEFFAPVVNKENNVVRVAMPDKTVIKGAIPDPEIFYEGFIKLKWENVEDIKVAYDFPLDIERDNEVGSKSNLFYALGLVVIIGMIVFYYVKRKGSKSRREQILQTFGENEEKIVRFLIEKNGSAKRNLIEKDLGIAKSSLAAAVNNLERKKILEINRDYSKHIIKLQRWFRKL